jgi:hypothetical protein
MTTANKGEEGEKEEEADGQNSGPATDKIIFPESHKKFNSARHKFSA